MHHCPESDDEAYFSLQCADNCTCYGRAFFCTDTRGLYSAVRSETDLQVRFLDLSGTRATPAELVSLTLLVSLDLCGCSLSQLGSEGFPNLRTLHLCDNLLTNVSESNFMHMSKLRHLSLAGNPLVDFQDEASLEVFQKLRSLDLSYVKITAADQLFSRAAFPQLKVLNLSGNTVTSVLDSGFKTLTKLNVLDLRGCSVMEFPRDLFQGLTQLQVVHADNYKLCCPATLPLGFNLHNCLSPRDSLSSCEDLLRSDFYRVMLFVFSLLAIVGNLGSCVFRLLSHKGPKNKSFHLFVTHLCMADFLMGIYLAIIGVADQVFRGRYLWEDVRWRRSRTCGVAGFLSLLSSEVSACIICLITLDRFLVLRFPLSRLRFGLTSAVVAVVMTWCLGVVVAAVPVLPDTRHWRLYGQNAICVALPVTGESDRGWLWSQVSLTGWMWSQVCLTGAGCGHR